MKAFHVLFLLVFLTSCGANTATQVINEATDTPVANVEQDVPTETEEVSDSEPDAEPDAPVESEDTDEIDAPLEDSDADAPAEDGGQDAPAETANAIDAELEAIEAEEVEVQEAEVVEETAPEAPQAAEPITEEVSDEVSSGQMIELSTTYTNPAMEAVMNITLEVDDNNAITSVEVTSPNYQGMPQFNAGVQWVIGLSLEEASEFYVSGSSLASPAFQKALKSAL